MKIINSLKKFIREDVGASAVEYALILALVGLAVATGAESLGTAVNNGLTTVGEKVGTTINSATGTSTGTGNTGSN